MSTSENPQPTPPHALLPAYYSSMGERSRFVRTLFDSTAGEYDRINALFSLGSGGFYRRQALIRAGLGSGQTVLDVAIGTGLVAREAAKIVGPDGLLIGLDLSFGMLREARRVASAQLLQGRAEALPLASASVDFISMGYALRHVSDLVLLFQEFHRVLRPGGRVAVLEISRPSSPILHSVMQFYLGRIVPLVSRGLGGKNAGTLMHYYWDTIEACVPAETIQAALTASGFTEVACANTYGTLRDFTATKQIINGRNL